MVEASDKPLCNIGVAITRPSGQAKELTQLIQSAGGLVTSFPLIEIVPLDDYTQFESVIGKLDDYGWLLFISSNAVHNSMPHLIKKGVPSTLKFAAIGPKTAQALGKFGFAEVLIPGSHQQDGDNSKARFDSESLLAMPEMNKMQGKKVMIVRGVGGRDVLAEMLKARGASVTFAECYQRINAQSNCDILAKAYANQQLQSIIVTSSEAMRYLLDLAGNADWLSNITICVNHARIAEVPLSIGLKVAVAEAPGDEAMMTLLFKAHS